MIITTAAGKLQDDSKSDSLDPAVTLWLVYAFLSVAISGGMLLASYFIPTILPAARLSQVAPRDLPMEIDKLSALKGIQKPVDDGDEYFSETKEKEKLLKAPAVTSPAIRYLFLVVSFGIIVIGWIMFGLGVSWGVHGSVIAGTVGE